MVEAEASGELASVVVASASVRDACVTDAETTGIVASSALENPLSVPMEMCCAVDVSRTVATLFAAAVAAAMARTDSLAVCIAVGCFFRNREAESWRQMYTRLRRILLRTCDSCGYAKDSTRLRAKESKGDDYNANRAINHEGEATCRIEQWWTRSDCYSSSFNQRKRDEGSRIVERRPLLVLLRTKATYTLCMHRYCDKELRLITPRPANCDPARLQSVPQSGLV